MKKAAETSRIAAETGYGPAEWNLATYYMRGLGVEEDRVTAYMWAYRSADHGYVQAQETLSRSGEDIESIISEYNDPEHTVTLDGTQYEGRIARCEALQPGMELACGISKGWDGKNYIELYHKGGSVGILYSVIDAYAPIVALLKLNRIALEVRVVSCIPKSRRGPRAKVADVRLRLSITEIKQ